jgi:U3 small nucleolar RNA-associated protein 11
LRAELEITAPPASASAGPSSEWSAAEELAEVEKLAEMGVVINPQASRTGKGKGKGKGKAPQQGHVVFADGKEECESDTETHWGGSSVC